MLSVVRGATIVGRAGWPGTRSRSSGVSLLAQPLGLAGLPYTIAAAALGAGFIVVARRGFAGPVEGAWARRAMLYSIAWLTALMVALVAFAR